MSESGSKRGLPLRVKMRHEPHFIESFAARYGTPIGMTVPLSQIETDPAQPRSSMGDLSELVTSVRSKGILEPLLVRPLPGGGQGEGPRYRIVAGERRFHAAREAGLFEVPVIELEVDDEGALEIALIENLQRKELTPFEEAEGYQALAQRHGYTHDRIAETVGKTRSVVTESLALLHLPARIRDVAQALGVSSKSVLLEIAKAGDEATMVRLLERVAEQGLTRDDLRRATRPRLTRSGAGRRKPYVFRFRDPDRSFDLSLTFRRSTVDRSDLIEALETILEKLKQEDVSER